VTTRKGRIAAVALGAAALLAVAALPERAAAQDTTRTRQPSPTTRRPTRGRAAPIEIRGTVPTPQVVTVRPRETPTYERRVLVPNFYDHDFWRSSILPGYQIVNRRELTGVLPGDSLAATPSGAATPPPPPATTGGAAADSTRRPPPGTAPAPTRR
jgi:hypothetical protein